MDKQRKFGPTCIASTLVLFGSLLWLTTNLVSFHSPIEVEIRRGMTVDEVRAIAAKHHAELTQAQPPSPLYYFVDDERFFGCKGSVIEMTFDQNGKLQDAYGKKYLLWSESYYEFDLH